MLELLGCFYRFGVFSELGRAVPGAGRPPEIKEKLVIKNSAFLIPDVVLVTVVVLAADSSNPAPEHRSSSGRLPGIFRGLPVKQ